MIEYSPSQTRALEALRNQNNVFVTGAAGSGKSFLIKEYYKELDPKKFPILASTGAAAVLVGGRTFHSFMGLGILEGGPRATIERALRDRKVVNRLRKIDGFVLDEVSMISAQTFEVAEAICCLARENSLEPWGGLRVIAVGDFAQLPPVERSGSTKAWAFLSRVWERSGFESIFLQQNMRTNDPDYLEILADVRMGEVTDKVQSFLDERIVDFSHDFPGTCLFPRKIQTDRLNQQKLAEIPSELKVFPSIYFGQKRFVDALKKQSPLAEELKVKEGCHLMIRQNDPRQRWVNGSTGVLEEIKDDWLLVRLENSRMAKIEKSTFSFLNAEGQPVASVTNFPVSLAYAATIHKAQGMTLDQAYIDISSLWEPGQAYVALSRLSSGRGLRLQGWSKRSIKADPVVSRFYKSFAPNGNA